MEFLQRTGIYRPLTLISLRLLIISRPIESQIPEKSGITEKLVVKAPIVIEKPVDEEPVQLKIPVNKNICVVPIKHIDPKPKIEKIVENPDKVRFSSV